MLLWGLFGLFVVSSPACKKKDKDDPGSGQNSGGGGGGGGGSGGDPSLGTIQFRLRGELLKFYVEESGYMYGRAHAFSHRLNRPTDTLECTISFAYPQSRPDTNYTVNITPAQTSTFVFILSIVRSRGDSIYASHTASKPPRFTMQVSVSNNTAQGSFSGWVYDAAEPTDSLQITDGEFQIRF